MAQKGPGEAPKFDASQTSTLRVGIVHTRWNSTVVGALVQGAVSSLAAAGVPPENIWTQSVPGSYELPFAVQRTYIASQTISAATLVSAATDLLGGSGTGEDSSSKDTTAKESNAPTGPLDVIIAIGVLIKGSTMHFEFISQSVSQGLMRVQLETGCPIVFGVLACLNEEQAYSRAGLDISGGTAKIKEGVAHGESGHNHGKDWGDAAVEMGVKRRAWAEGQFIS